MHIPFFHQNNSPLEQAKLDEEGNPVENEQVKPKNSKKIIIIAAVGVLLILIGILLLIPSQNLPFVQKPTPTPKPDVLLATVGDKQIYKSAVELAAREQYAQSAITLDVLKTFFPIVIERAILDYEAEKQKIIVTNQEIKNKVKELNPSQTQTPSQLKSLSTTARYLLLKNKIITTQIKSVEAYTIGFWIPPFSYPQKPEFTTQRLEGATALNEIDSRLKKGEEPLVIARSIDTKYPVLHEILAINGYLLKSLTDEKKAKTPRVYIYDKKNVGQPFFDTVFSLKTPGEIKKVEGKDGSGGSVIKLVSINKGESFSYEDWIKKQTTDLVKIYKQL